MRFSVSSFLSYEVFSATTFIFNIQAAVSETQIIVSELLTITPEIKYEEFMLKNSATRFIKMEVAKGTAFTISYEAVVEVLYQLIAPERLSTSMPLINLDNEILPFISPSRYCESDKLLDFAHRQFGHLPNEFSKVKAINEWVFNSIAYKAGTSDSNRSACDVLHLKEGVCKDFAHLAIALCRALDIPARYFTAYAYALDPPDFHACFEAYVGGKWLFFDPTQLSIPNGLVKIADAKDASEVAVASFFGEVNCTFMKIECHPLSVFIPMDAKKNKAISYG
ncbi:transglutaminase-like domain-containing protein [Flavobacterium sp. ARAG 55.4]|uniref:transglutaminase-like domain-containing protein n=1 Tax=Flavobacterium sp. ARAG 55.4 TaxID=3451357 RepID=UPI003F48116F